MTPSKVPTGVGNILTKILLTTLLGVTLTGCAGPMNLLAGIYDRQDSCQLKNNGGNYPSYCGSSSGRTYVYSTPWNAPIGNQVGYIK